MRTLICIILEVVLLAPGVILLGPFLALIPALEGTVSPEQLGDPDSRFIEVNNLRVRLKAAGPGIRCIAGSPPPEQARDSRAPCHALRLRRL